MEIDLNKVKTAWKSLENDEDRYLVKKGKFPHRVCYFDLSYAEHLELQRIAKKYFQKRKNKRA